jgi:hypothetical protein
MSCKLLIDKIFLEHPRSVNMNYFQHCCFSFCIGNYFLLGSIQAYIHGVIPCMFKTSSGDSALHISEIINSHKE